MEQMINLNQNFRVGELVWAKFSNYPYWPGYIRKILDNNTFEIYYLGDDEKSIEPKSKLKKWKEYFDEATKGEITDERFLFSLAVAFLIQEKDPRLHNHKEFINNISPEQKSDMIQEIKDFLEYSKTGDARKTLLKRKKRRPEEKTEELLKEIKPLKDEIVNSYKEIQKILDKYNKNLQGGDKNKYLSRGTSLALNTVKDILFPYSKKYEEFIAPFKDNLFEKMDTKEPTKLISSLGANLQILKKKKLARKCLKFFEIKNIFINVLRNIFSIEIDISVEDFYLSILRGEKIGDVKNLINEKIMEDSKRNFYRETMRKFFTGVFFYIQDEFIKIIVGYLESYCWFYNKKKINDDYIDIIQKIVKEVMEANKERNEWGLIKKGKSNGEIQTIYTLI